MSSEEVDRAKYPSLRKDLKVSKAVRTETITYVVKDPLKGDFFRFDKEEWDIISLFDGESTLEEIVEKYNSSHIGEPIELDSVVDYKDTLESMHLLEKCKKDHNLMLVEKMKEMRKSQLLSKKGSLFYKRFPIVDPDKFFDRVVPYISFIWTKPFIIFSSLLMLSAIIIILFKWSEFSMGIYQIFTFSEMSIWNILVLWVIVYVTIAIHELGHGLTCKFYGGEVHEIGFLFLFFQPCMYCNVNDAWLFDKKWKQIAVTISGGYIEFFIGAVFAFIWALTNPNTFINTISFQVMTICSASTVMFNFNPLMKLDGYYLFSDFTEVPNLKEDSFKYLKHVVATRIFRMPATEEFNNTRREKRVLLGYGIASFFYMFGLLTGLFGMAKGLLVGQFNEFGIIISLFIAYKIFWSYIKKAFTFLFKFTIHNREHIKKRPVKVGLILTAVLLVVLSVIPMPFKIYGECTLEASFVRVVRAITEGKVHMFVAHDGELVKPGDAIIAMNNFTIKYQEDMARLAVDKAKIELRQAIMNDNTKILGNKKELDAKEGELARKRFERDSLLLKYNNQRGHGLALLACDDEARKINTYFKSGDEICRLYGVKTLKTVIKVSENQVRFLQVDQPVKFKLKSSPFHTYEGIVAKIRQLSTSDPKNPKLKMYQAEMIIDNSKDSKEKPIGPLRPGMDGMAKIIANPVSMLHYLWIKFAETFRMDLFF